MYMNERIMKLNQSTLGYCLLVFSFRLLFKIYIIRIYMQACNKMSYQYFKNNKAF